MQPIAKRFYRSMYVTLGLACACLGYAELEFLPEMSVVAVVAGASLVVAYQVEGRWSLSLRAANVLGGVIGVIAIIWIAYQFSRADGMLMEQLPSPTWVLPYLGPLLMILIPAKLFRPKHNGDFWGLQAIGLIAVALGCALSGDVLFALLLLAYLTAAMTSLTLFYYYRQQETAVRIGRPANPPKTLARAALWAGVVCAAAWGMFLCTPRMSEARWELAGFSGRLQTGIDDNRPIIDLNRGGKLTVNRDKVFEVRAFTQDSPNPPPKTDVDPGQRWRQASFNHYGGGRWDNQDPGAAWGRVRGSRQRGPRDPQRPVVLADLGAGQYYFEFHLVQSGSAPRRIIAEPEASTIGPAGEDRVILASRRNDSRFSWIGQRNSDPAPPAFAASNVYDQVVLPPAEPGIGHPIVLDDIDLEHLRNAPSLQRLRTWSRDTLRSLVDSGRLPRAALGEPPTALTTGPDWLRDAFQRIILGRDWLSQPVAIGKVPPAHYEAVARAFEAHLAQSGEFKYSLTLARQNSSIDPVEDFVLNTKQGNCTRFATALALMLRTVGVPTRVVLGYHGFETDGDGIYDVLQCHAHSWVEAVVYRPPEKAGDSQWRWLTLDPTPSGDDEGQVEFTWGQWWENVRQGVAGFFRTFVIEYDSDRQERTRYAVSRIDWWHGPQMARRMVLGPQGDDWFRATALGAGVVAAVLVVRRLWRRRRTSERQISDPAAVLYQRFVYAMERGAGLTPHIGQTPGEFAAVAGKRLRSVPATGVVADLPAAVAALYYRARFGGRPSEADERRAIETGLGRLEQLLRTAAPL
jgi:hypothetical protein